MCSLHADRQVQLRRQMEQETQARGSVSLAVTLAEGDLIDRALEPEGNHLEKMKYVATTTAFIKAKDGHEAIQICLGPMLR